MRIPAALTVCAFVFLFSCGDAENQTGADSDTTAVAMGNDSSAIADLVQNDRSRIRDTVFHTALPPVFDGDIIMQNFDSPQTNLIHTLMGGKYNHVGMIFTRPKDGVLVVVDLLDSVRTTPLTDFVDRSTNGQVCLLRVKNANMTLDADKTKGLRTATKSYKGIPFDPVLNWDDSHLYSSELVWKIYNSIRLKLCPTRTVADFDISKSKKDELNTDFGLNVSDRDEAVSIDDIYNSPKLEIIYEK